MSLESATFIHQLVPSNPVGATDTKAQGDDHLRLIKQTLQNTFPNINGAVTATDEQLNAAGSLSDVITGFAAPTKKIGNTTNADGIATTAMRSDATIQLDTTINYTWAGTMKYIGNGDFNAIGQAEPAAAIGVTVGKPSLLLVYPSASTQNRAWSFIAGAVLDNALSLQVRDNTNNASELMRVSRDNIIFGNTSDEPQYSFLGNGGFNVDCPSEFANIATHNSHVFINGTNDSSELRFNSAAAPANERIWSFFGNVGGQFVGRTINDAVNAAVTWLTVDRNGHQINYVDFPAGELRYGGQEVGFRGMTWRTLNALPDALIQADNGRAVYVNVGGTLNLPALSSTALITVVNNQALNIVLAPTGGTDLTWYNGTGVLPTGNRTLAGGGVCTLHLLGTGWRLWGVGIS